MRAHSGPSSRKRCGPNILAPVHSKRERTDPVTPAPIRQGVDSAAHPDSLATRAVGENDGGLRRVAQFRLRAQQGLDAKAAEGYFTNSRPVLLSSLSTST